MAFYLGAAARAAHAEPKLIGSDRNILRNARTDGGLLASNAVHNLNNAVSEAAVSSFSGSGFRLYSGLMHIISQPGTILAISSMTKTEGSLQLGWTAPGLDGFWGNVNGTYRIDFSSDPSHVFAPTTYVTEFATTVVPGSPQVYNFSGLLPNTTYYTRIYLVDGRKVAAETSPQDDDSTLANLPANPVLSGVFFTSVTFTWNIPAGGAENFSVDASSNAFGPGGVVVTSKTPDGTIVSLSIVDLNPGSTYYFRLASFNWQSEPHFTSVYTVRTELGDPLPIENLHLSGNALAKTVLLTWTNRAFANPAGVLVQVSHDPIADDALSGTGYGVGHSFADGSTVKASSAGASYLETGLTLDTTRYFRLYSHDVFNTYAAYVSTYVILDLPPMAPAGYRMNTAADNSSMGIQWAGVASSLDGTMFKTPASPIEWELDHYEVYRATSIVRSGWVLIATAPISAVNYTAAIPDPTLDYYYKVVAKDTWGDATDASMVVDTKHNIYAVNEDQVTRMMVPNAMKDEMLAHGNSYARHMLMRVKDRPQDLSGRVMRSVEFEMMQTPLNERAPDFHFSKPVGGVTLGYTISNGKVVPSAYGPSSLGAAAIYPGDSAAQINADDALSNLGAYWYNNKDYVKMFGDVDPNSQTVHLDSQMAGIYQIRTVVRNAGLNLDLSGTFNKALTPNGDGLNDVTVFILDNPKDSAISGRIYDVRGSVVADMAQGPLGNSLQWDGKTNGVAVPRGVYVYRIEGEGRTFSGTVMVIR